MWVRCRMMSSEGERRYSDKGGSFWRRVPMWREMALHGGIYASAKGRTGRQRRMESSREPFMAPLGHVPGINIGGIGVMGGNISLGSLLLQGKRRRRVVQRRMEWVAEQRASGHSPMSMEDSKDDCNSIRCGG